MDLNIKKHWENIYQTKNFNEVSWYQENPKISVDIILSVKPNKNATIIDVGGGESKIVDNLINLGFKDISVLDISSKALRKSQKRLGDAAKIVNWICLDIKEFESDTKFDIWHDRALFHFLTSESDINKYVETVKKYLKPNGYLIIGTFSDKGPKKCSGLECKQYSEESIKKIFCDFKHIKSLEETHHTPFQTIQNFIYNVFQKIE